ncbi:MAG TPA: hypothetical protein VGG25_24400 [Streptosporangiaceae bacterium]|jgi:hypothetical protein
MGAPRVPAELPGHPDEVMRPERLAMLPPSRLSASRALVHQMIAQRWQVELRRMDIDGRARGEAVYRVTAGGEVFEFVVFSAEPAPGRRSGRIISEHWDMTGVLVQGRATAGLIDSARREMPRLYRGRAAPGTLLWCRSNRSERAFAHTVRRLAAGRQPDLARLAGIGYLMRNAALEGNGAFGTRSYLSLGAGHPLAAPYQAEMLAAYLIREFAADLAEHLASQLAGEAGRAAVLAPELRRYLGLGNGSGLGLVFFVNNHPLLMDRWLSDRAAALDAAARLPAGPGAPCLGRLGELIGRAIDYHAQDRLSYTAFPAPVSIAAGLRTAVGRLDALAATPAGLAGAGPEPGHPAGRVPGGGGGGEPGLGLGPEPGRGPGRGLDRGLGREADTAPCLGEVLSALAGGIGQPATEVLRALAIELVPGLADRLAAEPGREEVLARDPGMPLSRLRDIVASEYAWALRTDLDAPGARAYTWYRSRLAEEPRRGRRDEVPDGRDWALDLPGDLQLLMADTGPGLGDYSTGDYSTGEYGAGKYGPDGYGAGAGAVGEFLAAHPEHRAAVQRVQGLAGLRYHSPHMNMADEGFLPVQITRLVNAAFHGLDKTVNYRDRAVLGVLFQGAPSRGELAGWHGDWFWPPEPQPQPERQPQPEPGGPR